MRRKVVRVATCHADRPHHARGLCKHCYQHKLNRELRNGMRVPQVRPRTEWPQAVVKTGVKGWGSA